MTRLREIDLRGCGCKLLDRLARDRRPRARYRFPYLGVFLPQPPDAEACHVVPLDKAHLCVEAASVLVPYLALPAIAVVDHPGRFKRAVVAALCAVGGSRRH